MENLIERSVILVAAGEAIEAEHLFPDATQPPGTAPTHTLAPSGRLREVQAPARDTDLMDQLLASRLDLPALEQALIEQAVARSGGNLAAAARALGLTRPQLCYRLGKIRGETR